ncbi:MULTISPECIES: thioredoxin family protein [Cupriavidus]|uniref:thioredoxin family protein n=1 Tax=Cupriavidus TaxID=106589 RepID=UPI00157B7C19|nr:MULTISPECIES: thioredoxin family protein [Cupriavidus]MBB1635031.1 thiol reductase thioredoxin [Cupriavidus sp. UME77]NUA27361.1 thioredoxin family protein [Cupriavidus basilensis]
MTVYFPEQDQGAIAQVLAARPQGRLVACLCAAWCGTCGTYQEAFAALAARFPGDCFVWIDIETHADQLGDLDIDNFPTLLVQPAAGGAAQFYGTLLPHIEVLERMLARGAAMAPTAGAAVPNVLEWLAPRANDD